MSLYELVSLEFDKPAQIMGKFFEKKGYDIRRADLTGLCLRNNKAHVHDTISSEIPSDGKKRIVLYGHGRFHHYTYGLYLNATKGIDSHGYIHFDNHSDYKGYPETSDDILGCGAFVKELLKDSGAKAALFVGSKPPLEGTHQPHPSLSEDQLRKRKHFLRRGLNYDNLEERLSELPDDVYLSFDLDVLAASEILTGFDQGTMTVKELTEILGIIKAKKNIISADVLGFSGRRKDRGSANAYKAVVDTLLKP